MIDFNPATFELHFRALVAHPDSDLELDELDDALQQATVESEDARACAYITVEVLSSENRPEALAYALNTAVCASCMSGDTERVRRYLAQLVDLTIVGGVDMAALSAAENVGRLLPGNAKADHVPHVLYEVVRLYEQLGQIDKAIKNLIAAANLFADFGAFQPAYQSLGQAEELARDYRLLQPYADAIGALHAICLQEEDHVYAEKVWPTLVQKYAELGTPVPAHLAVNRATALFQTGDLAAARIAYEDILAAMSSRDAARPAVLMNLSACLRDLDEPGLARARMCDARTLMLSLDNVDPEHRLEMELIASRNAIAGGDPAEAVACLQRAAAHLEAGVALAEKLHYRRGFRDRYIRRMERLLSDLPVAGRAADVVGVIAATRANRVSDWLNFLEWAAALAAKLAPHEREELERLVDHLAHHGSPHLMGYHEKYDDPMSAIAKPDPWRDIAEYADRASARHGIGRPFQNATSERSVAVIVQRLNEGYALLVNLLTADHKLLLLLGERYVLCTLPEVQTREFYEALARHRQDPGKATTKALGQTIDGYQTALLDALAPVLDELAVSNCKGVIFLPDGMDLTPINLVMVGDPRIRARMAAGGFDVRTCIALYPAQRVASAPDACLGIVGSDSDLQYDRTDVEEFFRGAGTAGTVLENPGWDAFADRMASTDALFLSHHGVSVGLYTDPFFADMAGHGKKSVMSLMKLQGATFRWPHRLAVLGTCHSGSLVNRNQQQRFRAHELMGFPVVFLLNGRSEALAASWAIMDRFNLLFTSLFAPGLRDVHPSQAASTALAKLVDLPVQELAALLLRALPTGTQLSPGLVLQMDTLRQQPFCYGAYQVYTLL
ncbi:tetratricopeptide repeat protein [Xanthomonas sp. 3075]|uniref:tetratricopeptide repeat protein n=1 Tax=Xanthomonas sp. 3075 TaxID=3035315 RepID=UPI00161722EC|nr:tetratricopeptide repeat protein [Xanthomonas sp. 3075]MBB4132482.1 tetratricopeptide (TPR) repeat protein [Xanthomonas sp. 3075]